MNGTELGNAVAAIYYRAMRTATSILASGAKVVVVHEQLTQLKSECVDQLLELGRVRAAATAHVRLATDQALRARLQQFPTAEFQAYVGALNTLSGQDHETYKLGASINVLSQYADFELLAVQEPEEAVRLGIHAEAAPKSD